VGRSPVLQGFQQKTELLRDFLFTNTQALKNLFLDIQPVITDTAASYLMAV